LAVLHYTLALDNCENLVMYLGILPLGISLLNLCTLLAKEILYVKPRAHKLLINVNTGTGVLYFDLKDQLFQWFTQDLW